MGAFVCVYDQNYAIVIVTELKREEFAMRFDTKTQFSFLIQLYKTPFFWVYIVVDN